MTGFRSLNKPTYSSIDRLVDACKASGSLPFAKRECNEFAASTRDELSPKDARFLAAINEASQPFQIAEAAERWSGGVGLATTGI